MSRTGHQPAADSSIVAALRGPRGYEDAAALSACVGSALEKLGLPPDFVRPGDRVVLKPNWIRDADERYPGQDNRWQHVITHTRVLEAVIGWVAPRLQARGFNQAQLLAQALAPARCRRNLLLRIRDTPPQSGLGRAARWVGRTLGQLPDGTTLPWHRVIAAGGHLSLSAGSTAGAEQRARLRAEGISILNERVDMRRHGWRPMEHSS